jgi:activating signal cointegrator complex subunit 2
MVSQRPTFSLPPMALFPTAAWRHHLVPEEWEACLDAWISLAEAHMSLSALDFARLSSKDESLASFLVSFMAEVATSHDISPSMDVSRAKQLRKLSFLLTYRLLEVEAALKSLTDWTFLADVSKIYGKSHAAKLVTMVWRRSAPPLEVSMGSLKACLIKELDAGLKGDLPLVETQLKRLNHLLHASSDASAFFMAGTDFLDSLISCFKLMNPPLRKAILSTTYLCLIGLTEGEKPKFSSLVDQLYSLKSAGDVHKAGPTSANDSLVAELVTNTPILKQVQLRIDAGGSGSSRAKSVIAALENFRKVGSSGRPHPLVKRKFNKGKGVAKDDDVEHGSHGQIHIHRMSLVSQIQDLFPDLGSSFAVKMLDEYNDDAEEVIAHLLEGPLPAHLDKADRAEELYALLYLSRQQLTQSGSLHIKCQEAMRPV